MFDFVLRQSRLVDHPDLVDIGVSGGRIAVIAPNLPDGPPSRSAKGRLVCGGFVESHIHLDKACILDRCAICDGTLREAVTLTARAKAGFTQEDVYSRASRVVEQAIIHGTTRLRTFVEVDPRAQLRSFEAILQIKRDYAFAIDIDICAFAQEGLTQEMETHRLLETALRNGADLVGGCPYQDPKPDQHIRLILDLAERFGVFADFHIDFDLEPTGSDMPALIHETRERGLEGRVAIGHATKMSAMSTDAVERFGRQLSDAGIALTVLPATDLFLMGRDADRLVPRGVTRADRLGTLGVTTAIATNNVLNPFTPYGDASLIRMANLFANVAQLATNEELTDVFAMVTTSPARILGRDARVAIGASADLVLIDALDPASAVREIAQPLAGWKRGVQTFERPTPVILSADGTQRAAADRRVVPPRPDGPDLPETDR